MAKTAITGTDIELGGTDYSAQISEWALELEGDQEDITNFESAGWKEFTVGLLSATLRLTFIKDADLSGLDAAIYTAFAARSSVTFAALVDGGSAIATTNPEYQGSVKITSWAPGAQVGKVMGGQVSWPVTGAITRDVTP